MVNAPFSSAIAAQFEAAIDMLENAMRACPDELWAERGRSPEFWYVAFHTLFWLDCYLSPAADRFAPPAPFGLEEMDPAGVMPPRVYTRDELLDYLERGRRKCREALAELDAETAARRPDFSRLGLTQVELHLYNLRHVQHHAAQLNLILRQVTDSAPRWVRRGAMRD